MRHRALLLALCLLPAAGCDTVTPGVDSVILTAVVESNSTGAPVLFTFQGASAGSTAPLDLRCNCRIDLTDYLASQGFSRADVEAATVTGARISLGTPVNGRLDAFERVTVRLQAPSGTSYEVAASSSLPSEREAALAAASDRPVTSLVTGGSFEPVVQVTGRSLDPSAAWQLYLTLTFRIEAGGL